MSNTTTGKTTMRYTIYIIDRTNQFHERSFDTQEEADDNSDAWEAGGHNVFHDRTRALLAWDRYSHLINRHGMASTYTFK